MLQVPNDGHIQERAKCNDTSIAAAATQEETALRKTQILNAQLDRIGMGKYQVCRPPIVLISLG